MSQFFVTKMRVVRYTSTVTWVSAFQRGRNEGGGGGEVFPHPLFHSPPPPSPSRKAWYSGYPHCNLVDPSAWRMSDFVNLGGMIGTWGSCFDPGCITRSAEFLTKGPFLLCFQSFQSSQFYWPDEPSKIRSSCRSEIGLTLLIYIPMNESYVGNYRTESM